MMSKNLLFYGLLSSFLTMHAFDFGPFNPRGKLHDNDIISAYHVMARRPMPPEKFALIKLLSVKLHWSLRDVALYIGALDEVKESLHIDWLNIPAVPVVGSLLGNMVGELVSFVAPSLVYEETPSDQTIVGAYRVMTGKSITKSTFELCQNHRSDLAHFLLSLDETLMNLNIPALGKIDVFPIKLSNGGTIFGYKSDKYLAETLAQHGSWKPYLETTMKKIINSGDTVIDVGANIGYFTTVFAQCVGSQGKVCAFEPLAPLVSALRKSKNVNRLKHVEIYPYALSNREEKVFIKVNPTSPANSQVITPEEVPHYAPRFVTSTQTVALDTVFKQPLQQLHLIKIDCAGREDLVLRGARAHIKKFHPMIICKLNPAAYKKRNVSLQALLESYENLGYCYGIVKDIASSKNPAQEVLDNPLRGKQVVEYLKTNDLAQVDILAVWKGKHS